MTHQDTSATRRSKAAIALLAFGLLAGSVAPAAADLWPRDTDVYGATSQRSAFHRHFWRGSQLSQAPTPGAEMTTAADEAGPAEDAMAYCADRFRSYDPSTGTYLGYDGNEHSCP